MTLRPFTMRTGVRKGVCVHCGHITSGRSFLSAADAMAAHVVHAHGIAAPHIVGPVEVEPAIEAQP